MKVQFARRPIPKLTQIARDWDHLAAVRDSQLRNGLDISFSHVIGPALVSLCRTCDWTRVLDAGCGTGVLTEKLATEARDIVGIDVSSKSIALARTHSQLRYEVSSISSFAKREPASFTLVIANMVLMNAPSLRASIRALASLLRPGGRLVFSITHPWFWPAYCGYERARWFAYPRVMAVRSRFRISLDQKNLLPSTHIHRPLEVYLNVLSQAGLSLEQIREPLPPSSVPPAKRSELFYRCRIRSSWRDRRQHWW
jgi:SAM-dependent methyltransferase